MANDADETSEPTWLTRLIVEHIHDEQIREHGGDYAIRDDDLLESALTRPRNTHAYDETADLYDLAADYAFGLTRNHPFVDGNKRTAFLAAYVFLDLNGVELTADEPDVVAVVYALSGDDIGRGEFAEWLRDHSKRQD